LLLSLDMLSSTCCSGSSLSYRSSSIHSFIDVLIYVLSCSYRCTLYSSSFYLCLYRSFIMSSLCFTVPLYHSLCSLFCASPLCFIVQFDVLSNLLFHSYYYCFTYCCSGSLSYHYNSIFIISLSCFVSPLLYLILSSIHCFDYILSPSFIISLFSLSTISLIDLFHCLYPYLDSLFDHISLPHSYMLRSFISYIVDYIILSILLSFTIVLNSLIHYRSLCLVVLFLCVCSIIDLSWYCLFTIVHCSCLFISLFDHIYFIITNIIYCVFARLWCTALFYSFLNNINRFYLFYTYHTHLRSFIISFLDPSHSVFYLVISFNLFLFVVLNVCILIECNRIPYDLPESESELVAGYQTEFSSLYFSIIILSEYFSLIILSLLLVLLFNLYISFSLILLFFYCLIRASLNRFKYDEIIVLG